MKKQHWSTQPNLYCGFLSGQNVRMRNRHPILDRATEFLQFMRDEFKRKVATTNLGVPFRRGALFAARGIKCEIYTDSLAQRLLHFGDAAARGAMFSLISFTLVKNDRLMKFLRSSLFLWNCFFRLSPEPTGFWILHRI